MKDTDDRPTPDEAVASLAAAMPSYESAGVTLGLETYEQVPTASLVDTVHRVSSPALGICLDPANCIAALETPTSVIDRTAPYVKNLHVKDFTFRRRPGWVGFELVGAPLGTGQLDYRHLMDATRPAEHGVTRVVEHWLPWQDDAADPVAATLALERRWTRANLDYLKENS